MRIWWIGAAVALVMGVTESPALACSCSQVRSFSEIIQTAPVVVVGQVAATSEIPRQAPDDAPDRATVRPWMGAGFRITVASVAKGALTDTTIGVWNMLYGECGLRVPTTGTSVAIALWPVAGVPEDVRATWGAASTVPDTDYLSTSGCGQSLQVLSADDLAQWVGRKLE
jgi:hypothetical protein